MRQPVTFDTNDVTPSELSGFAPSEIRRRLRHACVLVGAAEPSTDQREQILRRARGHLAGTILKLDRLISEMASTRVPLDEQLTERHEHRRIEPSP